MRGCYHEGAALAPFVCHCPTLTPHTPLRALLPQLLPPLQGLHKPWEAHAHHEEEHHEEHHDAAAHQELK